MKQTYKHPRNGWFRKGHTYDPPRSTRDSVIGLDASILEWAVGADSSDHSVRKQDFALSNRPTCTRHWPASRTPQSHRWGWSVGHVAGRQWLGGIPQPSGPTLNAEMKSETIERTLPPNPMVGPGRRSEVLRRGKRPLETMSTGEYLVVPQNAG